MTDIKKVKRISLLVFFLVFITFLVVRGIFSPMLTILGFLCTAVFCISGSIENSLLLLLYLLPFAGVFKLSASSTSLFTYLEMLAVCRLIIQQRHINKKRLIILVAFSIYAMIGCRGNISLLIKQILLALLVDLFLSYGELNLKRIALLFSAGLISASVVAVLYQGNPQLANYISYERVYEISNLDIFRFSALDSDPNYYATQIVLALSCLGVLYIKKDIRLSFYILASVLIAFGAKTASKSFVVLLVIWILYMIILLLKEKRFFILLLVLVGGVLAIPMIFDGRISLFSSTLARFGSASNSADLTTGRSTILLYYIEYLFKNPIVLLFGKGIGSPYWNNHAAHNTYIDFLYFYGIIGTSLFALILKASLQKSIQKIDIRNAVPLICLTVAYFSLSAVKWYDFPFAIIIAVSFLRNPVKCSTKEVACYGEGLY